MREFEPTMRTIEDYNGNESKEHRKTVRWVIASILLIGAGYSAIHSSFDSVSDQIPNSENLLELKKDF
jgi:hypothetical protein